MNRPRTSLRAALDQLTQDFADALLEAVRQALRAALADVVESSNARHERRLLRRTAPDADTPAPQPAARPRARARTQHPQRSRATAAPRHELTPAPTETVARIEALVDPRAVPEGSEATREAADPSPASSPPERCWTVNVADGDQQEMAVEKIVGAYRAGIVTDETFVWKDGMSDWLVIRDVPEIFRAVTRDGGRSRHRARPMLRERALLETLEEAGASASIRERSPGPSTALGSTVLAGERPAGQRVVDAVGPDPVAARRGR